MEKPLDDRFPKFSEQKMIDDLIYCIGEYRNDYLETLLSSDVALNRSVVSKAFEESGAAKVYFEGFTEFVEKTHLKRSDITPLHFDPPRKTEKPQNSSVLKKWFYRVELDGEFVRMTLYAKDEWSRQQFDHCIEIAQKRKILAYDKDYQTLFHPDFPGLSLQFGTKSFVDIKDPLTDVFDNDGKRFIVLKDLTSLKNVYFLPLPEEPLGGQKFKVFNKQDRVVLEIYGDDFVETLTDLIKYKELFFIGKDRVLYDHHSPPLPVQIHVFGRYCKPNRKWCLPDLLCYQLEVNSQSVCMTICANEPFSQGQFADSIEYLAQKQKILNLDGYDRLYHPDFPDLPLKFQANVFADIRHPLTKVFDLTGKECILLWDFSVLRYVHFKPDTERSPGEEKNRVFNKQDHVILEIYGDDFVETLTNLIEHKELFFIGENRVLYEHHSPPLPVDVYIFESFSTKKKEHLTKLKSHKKENGHE